MNSKTLFTPFITWLEFNKFDERFPLKKIHQTKKDNKMSKVTLKNLNFQICFLMEKIMLLDLDKAKISQLTAPNGSGKSSIAMIIQETLFNKNIKGIKKADILNRWSKEKNWNSELTFVADDKDYVVSVTRTGAQTKVKLLEDGKDVSDHKVLDTYKMISEIVGLDFEVFSQLTYQSSTDLLEFLKATDANRKKFLNQSIQSRKVYL